MLIFFFSSRRRHTRSLRDWSSDVCSSDLGDGRPSAVLVRAVEDDDAHMGAQDVARVQAWAPEEITGRYEVKLVGTRGEDTTIVDLAARTHADLIAFRSEERRVGKRLDLGV